MNKRNSRVFKCDQCGFGPVDMDEVESIDVYLKDGDEFCIVHKECKCGISWIVTYKLVPIDLSRGF